MIVTGQAPPCVLSPRHPRAAPAPLSEERGYCVVKTVFSLSPGPRAHQASLQPAPFLCCLHLTHWTTRGQERFGKVPSIWACQLQQIKPQDAQLHLNFR